jgi:hypothetical protein
MNDDPRCGEVGFVGVITGSLLDAGKKAPAICINDSDAWKGGFSW